MSTDSSPNGSLSTASLPAVRQKTVGLHQGAKSLIRNVIRHTDTHNRLLEESEMWQTYYRLKREKPDESDKPKTVTEETPKGDSKGSAFRDPDVKNSFLYDDRKDMRWESQSRRGLQQAHMDEISENRHTDIGSSNSTFWMRQLQKVEDNDPDRWGHAGFKELYPDAFDSDRSTKKDDAEKKKLVKKTRTKREHKHRKSSDRKRRRRRSESDRVRKKEKRPRKHKIESSREKRNKKRRHSHDSSSDSSSDNLEKDRKSKKRKNSTETSDSDSETDEESKRKKSRRNMKTESEREKKKSREPTAHRSHKRRKRRKH